MKKIIALLLVMALSLFCLIGVVSIQSITGNSTSMVIDGPGSVPSPDPPPPIIP